MDSSTQWNVMFPLHQNQPIKYVVTSFLPYNSLECIKHNNENIIACHSFVAFPIKKRYF